MSGRFWRPGRLLRSSTFRWAILSAALFALTNIGLLGVVGWSTVSLLNLSIDRANDAELDRMRIVFHAGGPVSLVTEVNGRANSLLGRQRVYLLEDPSGRNLAGNLNQWPQGADRDGRPRFKTPAEFYEANRPVRAGVLQLDDGERLLIGRLQDDRQAFLHALRGTMLGGVVLSLVLGLATGLALARKALRRLDAINRTAETILREELRGWLATREAGDEFDQLESNLNAMLIRVRRLILSLREVTRNIAHELRTPLNRLRNRLELALLASPGSGGDETLSAAVGDVDNILTTFNSLLSIYRIEGLSPGQNVQPLRLAPLIEGVVDLYRPWAEDEGLTLTQQVGPDFVVEGDSHLLSQAVANLVDNAIKYTPAGGTVVLHAERASGRVRLTVADNGPGIPAERRADVLKPFVRLDGARPAKGAGLGLSVVAAIAGFHNAEIELADGQPGLLISLVFPQMSEMVALKKDGVKMTEV